MARIVTVLPGQLYVSANTLRATPGQHRAIVSEYGISHAVSVWNRTLDVNWSLYGVHVSWFPMPDGKAIDVARVTAAVARCLQEIALGGRVLIQCHAGRNRSMFVAALVVRELHGCPGAVALAHVRAVKPSAVANPAFEAYLRSLPAIEEDPPDELRAAASAAG
jgi:protein-tyrosine phosphatase